MFPPVNTKDVAAVAQFVRGKYSSLYPEASVEWFDRIFADIERLFTGRHPDYAAIDVGYHDFEHTLQATVCLASLLTGCHQSDAGPKFTSRQFQLAIAAMLLHDAGYLKLRSDTSGTGAKYTFCHVLRSCSFTAGYLPTLGATESEVGGVLGAINCTGPTKEISRLHFHDPIERFIGCMVATADYVGQMAAPDYPDELAILFGEFSESDDFIHVPPDRRVFKSAADLTARTPAFWRKLVLPKLDKDLQGVYRFLADPYPNGANLYLQAISRNIAIIEERIARATAASA